MQGNDKYNNHNLENGGKDNKNKQEDELIFDNMSIGNASVASGIDINEEMNACINYYGNIHFDDSAVPSKTGSKIKFRDCYSVPNATLAAGINYEDTFDTGTILKSLKYYNNVFNNGPNRKTNRLPPSSGRLYFGSPTRNESMMDYISRSHPLNGSSNLTSQYAMFHHDPKPLDSNGQYSPIKIKGKNNEDYERGSPSNSNPIPIRRPMSPLRAGYSASPLSSPKSAHSVIFDPNINTIPSYKGKRQSHHRRYPSTSSNIGKPGPSSFHPVNININLPGMPMVQEPIKSKDDHRNDDENAKEDEPLLMVKTNPITIDASPIKKTIHAKRRPSHPIQSSYGSGNYYGSFSSSKFSTSPVSSIVLAKTSKYIPDASLPDLVKTIDSHLVSDDDSTENIKKIYSMKGGDVARDIYNFNAKIKRSILSKRSKSEPNLYELNKKKENDFNVSEISTPGGFRREFISSNAKKHGKSPPHWITGNFIDFLALYGHYAGDDDFDEDYYSDDYEFMDDWESESMISEIGDKNKYDIFNDYIDEEEKLNLIETQSSFEVLEGLGHGPENKSKISIKIDEINENTPLLEGNISQSSINHRKNKKLNKKMNHSTQAGTASEGKTMFLLLKAFIGTGILFLPKAFANGGMLFSLVSLAFSGWLTYFTMILLIRCSEKFGGSYGDIGKYLFGRPFKVMIQGSIALTQSGFCCAYIIFILQSVKSIVSSVTNNSLIIPDWAIIAAQILIYIPLSWIRKIQNFSITSLIADVFILIGLMYIIGSDLLIISNEGLNNNFCLFNSEKFPLFLGTAIYAFEGIGLIIPLQRSMREPEKFPKVLKNSMYIISLAMFIVGGLSYYIFGDNVNTIIFMNVFPDSIAGIIVRALYTMAIVFSFPLTCYSGIHIVEPLFIPRRRPFKSFSMRRKRKKQMKYALLNQDNSSEMVLNNSNSNLNSLAPSPTEMDNKGLTPSSSYSVLNDIDNDNSNDQNQNQNQNQTQTQNQNQDYSHRHHRKRDTGKNSKIIKWMKNIFRAVFVSFLGLIAYYGASNLDNFVSLIGSFCCIPLMFIYPAILHYKGVAEKSSERMIDIAVIIFGIISTIWITKLSLEEWK